MILKLFHFRPEMKFDVNELLLSSVILHIFFLGKEISNFYTVY